MLDELRDSLYTVAWFGLMTSVWFGWAQESPPARLRIPLIVGSVSGVALAVCFGTITALNWGEPTVLDGRYGTFGVIVIAEFVVAAAGAGVLAWIGRTGWTAWWVALVVAVHFVSLAWIFGGPSLAVLGGVQIVALIIGAVLIAGRTHPTSRWVGPLMGSTILAYALVSALVVVNQLSDS